MVDYLLRELKRNDVEKLEVFELEDRFRSQLQREKEPLNIFIAYSRADISYCEELRKHLKILELSGEVNEVWYDGLIEVGSDWSNSIKDAMKKADIILLLISSDFIASEFCYQVEMKKAIELHEQKATVVVPVILRDCLWHKTPFGYLQALPQDGKPINSAEWENRDQPYREILDRLDRLIEKRQIDKIIR